MTFITVALGVGLAVFVIFRFKAPRPQIIASPPEVRVVREPAPPQQVIIKEVPTPLMRQELPPTPSPAPPPPTLPPPSNFVSGWTGVWRKEKGVFFVFQIKDDNSSITGTCLPNWGTYLPLRNATVIGNELSFTVEDGIIRTHFKMRKAGDNQAQLEYWITEDDWVESFKRANLAVRTPQQVLFYRQVLENNAKLRGKPVFAGLFNRSPYSLNEGSSQIGK